MRRRNGDRDIWVVLVVAVVASICSFLHYFLRNEILMYGDAVAHINIARRVFDSRSPGLDELGTVWLPLPHLLVMPFILSNTLWRTGMGGSVPSMMAYVAGVSGVFRLVRDNLREHPRARLAAWIAALVYGANPNLLYMQSTAMTESLSLALFVWAVVFFADFVRRVSAYATMRSAERSLWSCALALSGEMLTRYDGWFTACAMAIVLLAFFAVRAHQGRIEGASGQGLGDRKSGIEDRESATAGSLRHDLTGTANWTPVFIRFAVLIAMVPIFWFTYNYRLYGNVLEFATGPYSARAIAERTSHAGDPPYPGKEHPGVAAAYFVKAAALNLAGHRLEGEYGHWWRKNWQQDGWFFMLLAGTVVMLSSSGSGRYGRAAPPRSAAPRLFLLLWIPLPFYALSIAYGGVPIFIPAWWPYSYYNVRYGLQLLPLAAVCAALIVVRARWWKTVAVVVLAFVAVSYVGSWRTDPICLREAIVNSRSREALETQLAKALEELPSETTIFMSTGEHVGALERAGIPLKRTINENNYYAWREAQRSPASVADYAVAFDNDAVAKAVRDDPRFAVEQTLSVEGQAPATLYRRLRK